MAFLRIVNVPPRGLGKVTIGKIAEYARQKQISLLDASQEFVDSLSKRAADGLRKFIEMMDRCTRFATSPVEEIVGRILTESGYEKHVAASDERTDDDRTDNIRELLSAARQFDMLHSGSDYLEAFLEQTSLVADTDAWEDELDKVTMMTLHGSKGLEFPVVFMVAIEQGKLPHDRSREDPEQYEEERRLMFVGITRAEDALTISYAKYRDYRGQLSPTIPSPFLMELPREEMHIVEPGRGPSPDQWDGIDESGYEEEVFEEELFEEELEGDAFQDGHQNEEMSGELAEDALEFDPSMFGDEEEDATAPAASTPSLAGLQTAASLVSEEEVPKKKPPRPDPNVFVHGMRVKHPEYGLGKIIALSGNGKDRTATVNFVTVGEKSFVLSRSVLEPLG